MKKPWVLSYPLSAQRRLWSDWADVQADLSLHWAHTHFVGFVMPRLILSVPLNNGVRITPRKPPCAEKYQKNESFHRSHLKSVLYLFFIFLSGHIRHWISSVSLWALCILWSGVLEKSLEWSIGVDWNQILEWQISKTTLLKTLIWSLSFDFSIHFMTPRAKTFATPKFDFTPLQYSTPKLVWQN